MASPAKRRKKNYHQSTTQPARSLDFFFGKQKDAQVAAKKQRTPELPSSQEYLDRVPASSPALTDEELARQLQEEWNREEEARSIASQDALPQLQNIDAISESHNPNEEKRATTKEKENATLSLQAVTTTEDDVATHIPFDEAPLSFDPQVYISDLHSEWGASDSQASYGLLTRAFVLINSTQSRIKIVDTLTNFLRTLIEADPDSLLSAVCEPTGVGRNLLIGSSGLVDNQRDIPSIHRFGTWTRR